MELHQTSISYTLVLFASCCLLVSENFEIYPNFMPTMFPCFSKISSLLNTLFCQPFSALHVCILQFDFFHSYYSPYNVPLLLNNVRFVRHALLLHTYAFFDFICPLRNISLLLKKYQVRLTCFPTTSKRIFCSTVISFATYFFSIENITRAKEISTPSFSQISLHTQFLISTVFLLNLPHTIDTLFSIISNYSPRCV